MTADGPGEPGALDAGPAAARARLAAGDAAGALALVRAQLGWPAGRALEPAALAAWLAVVGEAAAARGADALAALAAEVVRDPDSPDRLYELGYALIDAGAPELAASVLARCLALVGESEEVVCELVSALETALAYPDALAVLEARPALRARSYMVRYLYAFDAAMSGRLDVTRAVLPALASDDPAHAPLRATIAGIVARAERVAAALGPDALGPRDLRGWHHVLTGGVLLHQSPYGFEGPMHGRYAWLQDSAARIATGLARLAALVAPLAPPCVYAPPGRGHEILAHAAARRLGVPVAPWPAVGVPAPGLVVIHDLGAVDQGVLAQLAQRRPDQLVYAHAAPWTRDVSIAADVTTLLYQILVAPWEAQVAIDAATGAPVPGAADARPAEAIGAELAAHPGLAADELAADEPARLDALLAAVWPLEPGARARQWAGGPVPSSRFT